MRKTTLLAALAFAFAAPAVSAAPVTTVINNVEVTSVTGERLTEAFALSANPGDTVDLSVRIDDAAPMADLFDFASDFIVFVMAGGGSGSISPCCITMMETDPTDGEISFEGSMAGFTALPFGDYDLFAGKFELTLSVDPADAPLMPFSTGQDVVDFLATASIAAEGFVEGVFINQNDMNDIFAQQINFATQVIPLPGAVWTFLAGLGALGAGRRLARH